MSDTLVPNELLAFLQYQLDVMDEVSVVQICKTNFTEEEIRSAKSLLYSSLNIADRMPSRRRDEKGERSLQDIIKVLKETDPDDVPTFVAKDLRKLPPVTFDHVDVTRLLRDITALRSSLAEMELKFEASQSTISDLRTEVVALRNTISLCRSSETSNINTRRGAQNASQASFESAKSAASPPAPATARALSADQANVTSSPSACPTSPPQMTSSVVASPSRNYAAATASQHPQKRSTNMLGVSRMVPTAPRSTDHTRKAQPDKDGFLKVERRKKKRNPPSQNKCGTAPSGVNHLLRAAIPTTQLYVSRLHYTTRAADLVDYIKTKTQFTVRVEQLQSRNKMNFNSFVVRVPSHCLPTFMKEEFWPTGVTYRRFRGRLRHVAPTLQNTSQCVI